MQKEYLGNQYKDEHGRPTNGATTGPHLHLGIRIDGEYVNPLKFYLTYEQQFDIILLKEGDYMQRQILHIDVNNAFLSWTAVERLKNG